MESDELQDIKDSFDEYVNEELENRAGCSAQKYHRYKHQRGTYQSVDASVHRTRATA